MLNLTFTLNLDYEVHIRFLSQLTKQGITTLHWMKTPTARAHPGIREGPARAHPTIPPISASYYSSGPPEGVYFPTVCRMLLVHCAGQSRAKVDFVLPFFYQHAYQATQLQAAGTRQVRIDPLQKI